MKVRPWAIDGIEPCQDEPFKNQPVGAFCTAFLISSNVVVTAGHCVETECDLQQTRFVFGFRMVDEHTAVTNFDSSNVYAGVKVIRQRLTSDLDYCVIELDRAVATEGVTALSIDSQTSPNIGDKIGLIGYPSGLPQKLAFGDDTRITDTSNASYISINTDSYGGNSGSPILDPTTGRVKGILVAGASDYYERTDGCFASITYPLQPGHERATRIAVVPWSIILSGRRPQNDDFSNRNTIETSGDTGDNTQATTEVDEPSLVKETGGKSLWWSWKAPASGLARVSTVGSDFDTFIVVYVGSSLRALQLISSSNNGGIKGPSDVRFAVVKNTEYAICVGGRCGAAGHVQLNLEQTENLEYEASNSTSLAIPNAGTSTPYASVIDVQGLTGVVSRAQVTLLGLASERVVQAAGLYAVLVAPSGQSVMLMGRAGGAGTLDDVVLTFDDEAYDQLSNSSGSGDAIRSGTYRPSAFQDKWLQSGPVPGPVAPYGVSMSDVTGASPNGTWSLYWWSDGIVSTNLALQHGWILRLATHENSAPVVSTIVDRTIGSSGTPVRVPFSIGDAETKAAALRVVTTASNPGLLSQGRIFVEGGGGGRVLHLFPSGHSSDESLVTVTVSDSAGATTSSRFFLRVLGAGEPQHLSTASISIPELGASARYPSQIEVQGVRGVVRRVQVTLLGLTARRVVQAAGLYAVLVAPSGQSVMLMGRAGGAGTLDDVVLTFDDGAYDQLSNSSGSGGAIRSGTYRPSGFQEKWLHSGPPPAPVAPYGVTMADVARGSPNGLWSLYLWSDGISGTDLKLSGGWALRLITDNDSSAGLTMFRDLDGVLLVTFSGMLQRRATLSSGSWITISNAVSPFRFAADGLEGYFRAAGSVAGGIDAAAHFEYGTR